MLGRAKDIAIKPATLAAPAAPRMLLPGVSHGSGFLQLTCPLSIIGPTCRLLLHLWGGTPQSLPATVSTVSEEVKGSMRFQTAFCQQSCHLVIQIGVVVSPKSMCISHQVVQVLSYHVVSCHIMLLLAQAATQLQPNILFPPHLVPWLPGATKAEAAIKAAVPVAAPAILDMAGMVAPWQDDFFQGLRFKALNLKT